MTTYITVADVDKLLGPDWTAADKKARAVLQANAYLTALNLLGLPDVTPDDVKQAGAFLASASAAGVLYRQQTESGAPTSKTVDADGIRSRRATPHHSRLAIRHCLKMSSWLSRC